ncbi:MAG: biopolymer transporter ExbD, partial [Blastocatellia bacterium]|nr:biopolymer transporter ExbD [Blastocatellia bacterium]
SGGPVSDINVTPMVDVMLVILIIFMVITPLITKGVSVELYKANNPIAMEKADQEDATVIAITRDGRPYLGSSVVQKEDIPAKVKAMMEGKLETTVYIKCDNRTRFNALTDVIDSLRSAGIDQLGLLTDRVKDNKPVTTAGGMH